MLAIRRAEERHHRQRERDSWLTFDARKRSDQFAKGFGALETLEEDRLPPGVSVPSRPQRNVEVITYVREGALAHEDTSGRRGIVNAGEFQRRTVGRGVRHSEANASEVDDAHVFRLLISPSRADLEPGQEQKRFSVADRRGGLCVVASPDASRGSLRLHQDAFLYSALLESGQHVVHELSPGRSVWLHLVHGEVTLDDVVLTTGDGAGVSAQPAVSFTARGGSEILLLDLGERTPASSREVRQNT